MRDKIVDIMPEMKTGKAGLFEGNTGISCLHMGKKQHGAAGGIVRYL